MILPLAARPTERADAADTRSITLPYLGTDSRSAPSGWSITACPAGKGPDLVSLTCDDGQISFTATDYDRGAGKQKATIAFTAQGTSKTETYSISLEAPQLAVPITAKYRYPLPQGTRTTVPYSALTYTCQSCTTASPQFRAGSVTPKKAGSVRFSGTGVVFDPSPDFSGKATLHYRVRDRYGQQSERAAVKVTVVSGRSHAPTMVATAVSAAAGRQAAGNALSRDIVEKKYPARLTSCGKPVHGTVSCKGDGTFVYTPAKGFVGIDEFGYHVFTKKSGDQAVGTVVVQIGGSQSKSALAKVTSPEASAQKTPVFTPLPQKDGS